MNKKQLEDAIINEWAFYKSKSENPNFSQLKFKFAMYIQTDKKILFSQIKKLYPNVDCQQIIQSILINY